MTLRSTLGAVFLPLLAIAGCTTPIAIDASTDVPNADVPATDVPLTDGEVPIDAPTDGGTITPVACEVAPRCPVCTGLETCGGGGVLHECGRRACTHYVSPTATASGFDACTTAASPCTLASANASANAGDVVCLIGGEYRGTAIRPVNSGTAGMPIVFQAADPADRPVLRRIFGSFPVGSAYLLQNVSFIEIDSVDVLGNGGYEGFQTGPDPVDAFFVLQNADDVWIRNGRFQEGRRYRGGETDEASSRIRITSNVFPDAPGPMFDLDDEAFDNETWPADTLYVDESSDVLVEDNVLGDASHAPISVRIGAGNVILRRNTMRNRLHSGILIGGFSSRTGRVLVEDNHILDSGAEHGRNPYRRARLRIEPLPYDDNMIRGRHPALQIVGPNVLARRNEGARNGRGAWISAYRPDDPESGFFAPRHLRLAHNTFHDNFTNLIAARDIGGQLLCDMTGDPVCTGGMVCMQSSGRVPCGTASGCSCMDPTAPFVDDAYVANNVFDEFGLRHAHTASLADMGLTIINNGWSAGGMIRIPPAAERTVADTDTALMTWSRNLTIVPAFVGAATDDYRLESVSEAIDVGIELAHVTASAPVSGGGTTLTVDDTLWFFDGWDIAGQSGDVLMTSTGTVLHVVSIDDVARTIVVEETVSPAAGEGLGYAYTGEAADLGAHERCE